MNKKYKKYSDKELLKLIHNEDKKIADAAFVQIYDRYALRINAYCYTILGDREQAEDVLQETFIRLYQYADPEFQSGTIIGYLIRIARNLCLNIKRSNREFFSIEDYDFPINNEIDYDNKELSELVLMAMDLLDFKSKEILTMRVFNEIPYSEIAQIFNITEARARYIVFKTKEKIKKILAPYFDDVPKLMIKK